MWREMCHPHGKLLMAMLAELRPAMSVKRERQLTIVRMVKETMNGRSHPQKKAEWSRWGSDCPMGRVGCGWLFEAVY